MNITFIGMSGAGKSTVGEAVAKQLGYFFYDVDREMELEYGKPLQEILDGLGDEGFLQEQAQQVLNLGEVDERVIAPGGSVVYTPKAMEYLKEHSTIMYIKVSCETAKQRLTLSERGIVGMKSNTFEELFAEREGLYKKYADVTIEAEGKPIEHIVEGVLNQI